MMSSHQYGNNVQQYYGGSSTVSTQQQSLTWNGSKWVPVAQQPQQPATWTSQQQPNRVQMYTDYYHKYMEFVKLYQQQLAAATTDAARSDAEYRRQWAQYQADESSRAAHFFHENPHMQQAPFDLPVTPPALPSSFPSQTTTAAQQQQQPPASNTSRSVGGRNPTEPGESPQSLKVFVDRCLRGCRTEQEKASMMTQVEKLIQDALMKGVLQSKDWSLEPIPGASTRSYKDALAGPSQESPRKKKLKSHHSFSNSNTVSTTSYYGPSSGSVDMTTSSNHQNKKTKAPVRSETSYYGPIAVKKDEEENFLAFQKGPSKSRKWERKNSGFDQSTNVLNNRAKRFSGPGGITDVASSTKSVSNFDKYMGKGTIGNNAKKHLSEEDYEQMTVKGKNMTLEKEYLRLTAPPRPELVRPQPVLERHLHNLKAERLRPDRRDYLWFCSQLKAIRQDCTVQRIRNAFAVDVYETHAKIALEEADLNEYNQSQTQLKELYQQQDPKATAHRLEFLAYRILYYVFLAGNEKYRGGSSDLFQLMLSLTAAEKMDPAIRHALQVREAASQMNYHEFFALRKTCPNLGSYLMDHLVPTIRHQALLRMCKAYRPTVSVEFVLSELGFSTSDLEFGRKWLKSCGCVLVEEETKINTKDSVVHESDMEDKKSLI